MGCCRPFSAVATTAAADPHRHVNFTAGMVLGVDDYRQEFAYHSARDKWIVRDFLGYGTLSGLAVFHHGAVRPVVHDPVDAELGVELGPEAGGEEAVGEEPARRVDDEDVELGFRNRVAVRPDRLAEEADGDVHVL